MQADAYLREGLALARQIGHREWISILLLNLAEITIAQGYYEQAEDYLQETLNLAQQIGRPSITTKALNEYGNLYLKQKKLDAAQSTFQKVLTIVPEGEQDLIALGQYGLARVAEAQGNSEEARKLGEASVLTLEKIGHHDAKEVRDWLNTLKNRD